MRERALTGAPFGVDSGGPSADDRSDPQELLAGIRQEERFVTLRNCLGAFDEAGIDITDHEEAAHMHNLCRARGIAGLGD